MGSLFGLALACVLACGPVVDDAAEDDSDGGDSSSASTTGPTSASASATGPLDEATSDTPAPPSGIAGDHLLAIAAVISPATPLQFIATVTEEGDTLGFSLQPLSLDVTSTTSPRKPVGPPIVTSAVLNDDGSFVLALGPTTFAGETNPITGSVIEGDVTLTGRIESPDYWCGDVTGSITAPLQLDLAGSTFAGVRIVGALPGDPITAACGR